jgi:hypothetical protein
MSSHNPLDRDGPIHPEDHPMTPWPVRLGLKEMRHKREIEELQRQLKLEENPSMIRKLLWYSFWGWTIYVTLAYFGFLDAAKPLIDALLESFQEINNLVHF